MLLAGGYTTTHRRQHSQDVGPATTPVEQQPWYTSVVMSSISRSTVDCNSTTLQPRRSSPGTYNSLVYIRAPMNSTIQHATANVHCLACWIDNSALALSTAHVCSHTCRYVRTYVRMYVGKHTHTHHMHKELMNQLESLLA